MNIALVADMAAAGFPRFVAEPAYSVTMTVTSDQ
jgi:hypothetical protein